MNVLNSRVNRVWIIAVCATTLLVGVATGQSLPVSTQNVNTSGFIYTIGLNVFADQACTINVAKFDWGTLMPGDQIVKTGYLKNTGSANQTLFLATANWLPSVMQNYLTLSWNATNYSIGPNQVVPITFTLSVSSIIPSTQGGTFSFSILISGQGT